jgi:hypothetical protein
MLIYKKNFGGWLPGIVGVTIRFEGGFWNNNRCGRSTAPPDLSKSPRRYQLKKQSVFNKACSTKLI